MKPRKFAILPDAEIRIGTTPVTICRVLDSIVECADYNSKHSESEGSETQKDQLVIVEVLSKASQEIRSKSRENWRNSKYDRL